MRLSESSIGIRGAGLCVEGRVELRQVARDVDDRLLDLKATLKAYA